MDGCYPGSVRSLVGLLFTERSPFTGTFMERVGRSNITVGEWACEGSSCVRTVSYVGKKAGVVPEHDAIEEQHLKRLPGGECVVNVRTSTPRVPFGNTFVTVVQYSLSDPAAADSGDEQRAQVPRAAAERKGRPGAPAARTRVVVSWDLVWRGRPPVVGGMVRSGARQGLKANFDAFAE
eukprot:5970805-Prymnesium_polylepis.1